MTHTRLELVIDLLGWRGGTLEQANFEMYEMELLEEGESILDLSEDNFKCLLVDLENILANDDGDE